MPNHFETEKTSSMDSAWPITPTLARIRVVKGHLADFGALGKMRIALERNKLASLTLCRSTKNPLGYLGMV